MHDFYKKIFYSIKSVISIFTNYNQLNNIQFFFNCIRLNHPFYKLNINQPKTFNEKILFLKKKSPKPIFSKVADKFLVREYIMEKIGSNYLIPLYWYSENINDFHRELLKRKCIVKLNNGSGANFIINEPVNDIDFNKIKNKLARLLNKDFSLSTNEKHYKHIKNLILIEKLLDTPLNDYKFFCSKGKPFMIQVDVDRFTNHCRNFYNLSWEKQDIIFCYPNSDTEIEKPTNLKEMISISKSLSEEFTFCRVDLYSSNNKVYFGEITLFPEGGVGPFSSYNTDLGMGKYLSVN